MGVTLDLQNLLDRIDLIDENSPLSLYNKCGFCNNIICASVHDY